jgi:Zn ribbon nucleic-acid-binding protein
MKHETKFDTSDEVCPQCGSVLDAARYVRMVQSRAVGAPVGMVEDETLDEWLECLDCGYVDRDLADLPEGARQDWAEVWGNER